MTVSQTPATTVSRDTREWLYIALILVFALIVISPLLQPGYFWGAHDARHDAYFIFQYDKSVQDGIWFPRWSPDWTFGYGYPFFIVYGPLATFVGELFHHFLGLGFEASVKAVLALSIVVSGFAMYGFVRSWLGRNAGLVAAVAFMAIPYHLVDVYVRAALAESVALAFLPLALWGFRETVRRPRLTAILGAGFAYAAIMWTSNLVALIFTPGLAAYVAILIFWQWRRQPLAEEGGSEAAAREQMSKGRSFGSLVRLLLAPAAAFALGLGLSAAFFVPALIETGVYQPDAVVRRILRPDPAFRVLLPVVQPSLGLRHQPARTGRRRSGCDELPVGRGRDAALAGGAGHGPLVEAIGAAGGLVLGSVGCGQRLPHAECLGPGLALPADRALRPVPLALSDAGDHAVEHPAGDVGGRWQMADGGWQIADCKRGSLVAGVFVERAAAVEQLSLISVWRCASRQWNRGRFLTRP